MASSEARSQSASRPRHRRIRGRASAGPDAGIRPGGKSDYWPGSVALVSTEPSAGPLFAAPLAPGPVVPPAGEPFSPEFPPLVAPLEALPVAVDRFPVFTVCL